MFKVIKPRLYLRVLLLKYRVLVLRVTQSRLKLLILRTKLINLLLQAENVFLQLRYSWGCFVHNLMLGYQNKHDGNEPPNKKS